MSPKLTAACWKLLFRMIITIMQSHFIQNEQAYRREVAEIALDAAELGQRFIAEGWED